jgi:hypothetical protein
MTNYFNSEVPLSSTDCAEIEALFIELMRARDVDTPSDAVHPDPNFFFEPPRHG